LLAVKIPPSLLSVALFQQAAAADVSSRFIPLLAHLSSHKNVNAPKLDYHDSL